MVDQLIKEKPLMPMSREEAESLLNLDYQQKKELYLLFKYCDDQMIGIWDLEDLEKLCKFILKNSDIKKNIVFMIII